MLSLFGEGSSREGTTTLRAQALKHQGKLYLDGLAEINRFLASRGEPGAEGDSGGRMVAYLTSVFHGHYSAKEVGPRDSRELRTLAEALDALAAGNLPAVGDLLTQRFKAVECKIQDGGDWGTASHLELISDRPVGLTTLAEQTVAARQQLLRLKLDEAKKKHRDPGPVR